MRLLAAIVLVSFLACTLRAEEAEPQADPAPDVSARKVIKYRPSDAKFNSAASSTTLAPAGQALTADGTGKSFWAFVKGTAVDSGAASSGMVLTADGSGKSVWGSLSTANLTGALGNSQLTNSSLTVTAGTGLTGGGTVALGGITTLSLGSNLTLGGTTNGTFNGPLIGNVTGNVTGSAGSFTGNLAGDVTGTQGATVVATVGGATAANIATAAANAIIPVGMVLIPAGTFTMGNSIGDGDIIDAAPVAVTVSAFYMDANLVSYSQWRTVYLWATTQATPYVFLNAGFGSGPNQPVQTLDWFDCVKWCNARSEREGKTPVYYTDAGFTQVYRSGDSGTTVYANFANKGYRLPTEAEWEKAARGGLSGQRFPWGNLIDRNLANYNATNGTLPSYDLGPATSTNATTAAGTFASNGYGLNDMAGNVYQWCWDWYATPYAGGTEPHGPASGTSRVLRGGNFNSPSAPCRSARRNPLPPSFADAYGLRTVLIP
ncbi:MAG TPA: formylglycine-generating enzyme family protein [Planctomycetota bacterium]|nr:formylglycine-generating enzyme family protein [Planctomycetota bacterium]